MSEWITDRLPTAEDAMADGRVFMMSNDGSVVLWPYGLVELGEPWQPVPVPVPYVKPKRWTVSWSQHGNVGTWTLYSHNQSAHTLCGDLPTDAAERICDIYNEVMP